MRNRDIEARNHGSAGNGEVVILHHPLPEGRLVEQQISIFNSKAFTAADAEPKLKLISSIDFLESWGIMI